MDNINKSISCLEALYYLLRDEGFSIHSQEIKKLIVDLDNHDFKRFKKDIKSAIIWGGAGSTRDIDFRDEAKNKKLNELLSEIKRLK